MDATQLMGILFGLIQALGGAICLHLYNQVGKVDKANDDLATQLADYKLHAAETFATKSESTRAFDTLNRTLEALVATVNQRFDKVDQKLDRKADKA